MLCIFPKFLNILAFYISVISYKDIGTFVSVGHLWIWLENHLLVCVCIKNRKLKKKDYKKKENKDENTKQGQNKSRN